MQVKKFLLITAGSISLGFGCLGIILPILPTVPFFLLTLFCFTKSSKRLHDWFVSTKMYRKHLEAFVKHKGMTAKTKAMVLVSVTLVMAFGFAMMGRVPVGRVILSIVWACHAVYFLFVVKTLKPAG